MPDSKTPKRTNGAADPTRPAQGNRLDLISKKGGKAKSPSRTYHFWYSGRYSEINYPFAVMLALLTRDRVVSERTLLEQFIPDELIVGDERIVQSAMRGLRDFFQEKIGMDLPVTYCGKNREYTWRGERVELEGFRNATRRFADSQHLIAAVLGLSPAEAAAAKANSKAGNGRKRVRPLVISGERAFIISAPMPMKPPAFGRRVIRCLRRQRPSESTP